MMFCDMMLDGWGAISEGDLDYVFGMMSDGWGSVSEGDVDDMFWHDVGWMG